MASNRLFLVAAACTLPLSLIACGDSGEEKIVPEGEHHGYVVSKVSIPTTDAEVTTFGLDLGSKSSSKPDGPVDNQLGAILSFLSGSFHFDVQGTVTAAVDSGTILLLIDVQTKDFATSNAAGFGVKIGANPMPAPCNSPTDCRHHLNGMGTFSIAPNSPTDAVVAGKITSGTFKGGPGDIAVQIALGSTTAITLNLLNARVQASSISDTGIMTANVGGLVTQQDLAMGLAPAIATSVNGLIMASCPAPRTPPNCGCTGNNLTVLQQLDGKAPGTVADCTITGEEVIGAPFVQVFLQPDVCSTSSCKTPDALSIGIKVEAVKATFPM